MTVHLKWHGPFRVKPDRNAGATARANALVDKTLYQKKGIYVLTVERRLQPWTSSVWYIGKTSDQTFLERMKQHFKPRSTEPAGFLLDNPGQSFNNNEIWSAEQHQFCVTVWFGEVINEMRDPTFAIEQAERSYIYLLDGSQNQRTIDGPSELTTIINSAENCSVPSILPLAWSPSALPHLMIVYPKSDKAAWAECFFVKGKDAKYLRRRYSTSRGSLWAGRYSEKPPLNLVDRS